MAISPTIRKITFSVVLTLIAVAAQAQIVMTGTVRNEAGETLVGAYIKVDQSQIATLSDLDGKFTLPVPEQLSEHKVSVSYAGYLLKKIDVAAGNYDIILLDREKQLIDEIRVSTQKRLQRTVEVPIAVSVIDSAKIRQTGLSSIDEMSNLVPGFHATVPDAQVVFYNIRGVSSVEPESYGQSRISVFMDGISISRIQTANMELYDMERIEVVKGPQGTLFGRGAELGAVHYIRKKPSDQFEVNLSTQYGNYNQRKVVGVLNTPAGSHFANRFAFDYNAHDGFLKNSAGGRLNGANAIALRNSSVLRFGNGNAFNIVVDYQHDHTPGYAYQSKTQFNELGEVTTTNKSPFTTANHNRGKDLYMKRDIGGVLTQLDLTLGEHFDITSTSGFRAFNTAELFDIDGTMLRIVDGLEKTNGVQVSEEIRCNWNSNRKVNGFFGASYFYEHNKHNYMFSGNLHYIYPLAVGKNLKTSLASLPEQIISNVGQIINNWAQEQNETTFKDVADMEVDGKKVSEIMSTVIADFATNVTESIRGQVDSQFSKWFDVIYWDKTPDFFNDTKNIITSTLKNEINRLLENDTYDIKFIFEQKNMTGESIINSIDFESGLTGLQPFSNLELDDEHEENEIDYNRNHEASIFADFNWNFLKNLYLTLGIRGTYESSKTGYSSTSWTAPMLGHILYVTTNGEVVWTEKEYKSWVGRAVLNWMFNPTHNLYFSASKGRRPGMIYFNYRPDDVVHLSPELTYSYELGIKGTSKYGHLSYTAAFYYYDWKNFQTSVAARGSASDGSLTYVSDDNGNAYGAGAELSGMYTFNPNVSLYADFSYNGGTFKDKDMNGVEQINSGNIFPMIPAFMFNVGLNWKRQLSGTKVIYFHPSFYTQSKVFFNVANNPELSQSAYLLLNANTGIQWTKRRVTYDVGLYGHNITNTKYVVDAGNSGEVIGLPTYEIGQPATVYLAFRLHLK